MVMVLMLENITVNEINIIVALCLAQYTLVLAHLCVKVPRPA